MIIVMRSNTQNLLRVLFLVGFVASFAVWQRNEVQFDTFKFTQQWPVAVCVDIDNSHGTKCAFPPNVKGWTIHGLWPDCNSGKDPFYCNDSYPFIESQIKDLEPLMLKHWPNMVAGEDRTSFWKHEWEKHGTCSMSLPALDTEHKFFNQSLVLNSKFNLTSILASQGIVPSQTKRYDLDAIRKAIQAFTSIENGAVVQCIFSEDHKHQALIQIELCLSKTFQPIKCISENYLSTFVPKWDLIPYNPRYEDCTKRFGIQYLPFNSTDTAKYFHTFSM